MMSARTLAVVVATGIVCSVARAQDTRMPSIVHEACAQYQKGKPFKIVARFEDDSQLFDQKVMYRTAQDRRWRTAPLVRDPNGQDFSVTIRAKDLKGNLEYFIEVFDEFGNGPARIGSPDAPIWVIPAKNPAPCIQVPGAAPITNLASSALPIAGPDLTPPPSRETRQEHQLSVTLPEPIAKWWTPLLRNGGYVATGLGLAIVAVGAVFGRQGAAERDSIDRNTGMSQQESLSRHGKASELFDRANLSFALGGGVATLGIGVIAFDFLFASPPPSATVGSASLGETTSHDPE
jgi:hypothetical protein